MIEVAFNVEGNPRPKGNHRAKLRGGRPKIYDSTKGLTAWEKAIKVQAATVAPPSPIEGPVVLSAAFRCSRFKVIGVKVKARRIQLRGAWPTALGIGDLDKLIRAVGDALTGSIYKDDSQVVQVVASKSWAEPGEAPGVSVVVREIPAGQQTLF